MASRVLSARAPSPSSHSASKSPDLVLSTSPSPPPPPSSPFPSLSPSPSSTSTSTSREEDAPDPPSPAPEPSPSLSPSSSVLRRDLLARKMDLLSNMAQQETGDAPTYDHCDEHHGDDDDDDDVDDDVDVALAAASSSSSTTIRVAGRAVAPFLAKHIPLQYAPLGSHRTMNSQKNPNTKYCYRHRPDLKCRRTADEPSMENLQRDLESLSKGDQQAVSHVWSLFSAAPAKHRNLMLQGILTQCCFPQLSYLSAAVRDLIRIDFVTALPAEVSYKILCYLDTTSLCKAAQVSQRWRALADDDVVWHKMCEQHIDRKCTKCGWGLPLLERKRLRDWKRQQRLRATGRGLNQWSPEFPASDDASLENEIAQLPTLNGKRKAGPISPEVVKRARTTGVHREEAAHVDQKRYRPWKDVYKDRFKVGSNWKHGRCTTRIFRGHTNGVMCLQFDDNILATGSYDSTIKIWDITTGEELRTLHGHASGIRALQFDDMKLISGSLDKTLRVWNWRTGECLSTYQGHTDGVIALHFDANILASGSIDRTVKIWNFEDKSTFSLKGHKDWVNAVKVDSASRTVFSASDDCTVRLWDLDTKTCIKAFEGHAGQVQQVLPLPADYEPDLPDDEDDEDSTSNNSSTSLMDQPLSPTSIRHSYGEAFTSSTGTSRPLPPRYMLTGALDSTVRLWDVGTGKCLKKFFGHVEGVWALAGDTLRVVSGAQDCMVKVWDVRTGKYMRTFTGHAGPVTCIGLSDSRMCTGGEDYEVRMYCFRVEEGVEFVVGPNGDGNASSGVAVDGGN